MTVACLIGLAQARCHYSAVLACGALALSLGMPAAACAALTNSLDLSPNHAGAIQGLAGFVAALASLVAPSYKLYLITGQVRLGFMLFGWKMGSNSIYRANTVLSIYSSVHTVTVLVCFRIKIHYFQLLCIY